MASSKITVTIHIVPLNITILAVYFFFLKLRRQEPIGYKPITKTVYTSKNKSHVYMWVWVKFDY
jgi:hypothetical protein